MKKEQIEKDVYVVTGEAFESNSIILIKDDELLVIDALASRKDAEMRKCGNRFELKAAQETKFLANHAAASDTIAASNRTSWRKTVLLLRHVS